jgi:hypothetical protein
VSFLKWLTLSLLAYAGVLFTVHVPWGEVALRTVWPRFTPNAATAAVVVGVFGTTISPYLFFWQASEEVEDMHAADADPLVRDAQTAPKELRRMRWDTWSGMFYSDLTAWFIILATAVTLHVAGITDIDTAAQAAGALRPLAGNFAFVLFTLGILGVGLIGVPVLAGSGAYALAEARGWHFGLERPLGIGHPVLADQSDEGVILERRHQRSGRRAAHGGDHPARLEEIGDGRVHRQPADRHPRLDCHRRHGGGGGANVHPRLNATPQHHAPRACSAEECESPQRPPTDRAAAAARRVGDDQGR